MKLIIGNKNYSSWSLRPWIALKMAGLPFKEEVIPLYEPGSREAVLRYTPAGKVPVLIDGAIAVWESLAILEYLAEKFPGAGLWPSDVAARTHARVISNEMHAGFMPLRRACPMNFWLPPKPRQFAADVIDNVRRIDELWSDCLTRYGGPFLFGATFGAADAMYAPVVARFYNYAHDVSPRSQGYMRAVMATAAWREWRTAAFQESWVMQGNEPDWPQVSKLKE
jgi:glutathione S-transferase